MLSHLPLSMVTTEGETMKQLVYALFWFFPVILICIQGLGANPKKVIPSQKLRDPKLFSLQIAIQESILYLQKLPQDTKFLFRGETYSPNEILHPLQKIQKQIHLYETAELLTEVKKIFQEVELKTGNDLPLITGYYEVRVQGKTKPEGHYAHPALVPPKRGNVDAKVVSFPREYWKEESHWKSHSQAIVFLRLTDLHLAQLEGSAIVQTETKEVFRINYSSDNGLDYVSPSVHLTGVCQSLKPYHLSNCMETNPNEVTDAIWKNPRYIFFEKETIHNHKSNSIPIGPLGSGGIRLVEGRSVAMDKQIPLGFPVLLSFPSTKQTYHDHLAFVHDRGNAIQGEGRVDFYLGNGFGVDEVANQLLTKGKVVLLVPRKKDCQTVSPKECNRRQSKSME
ncbi:murein transglycosylase [Leptospira yanagawae]|uniref:peptidoglycan lytic exotransglycosylase n=2 Tax=Leptospira yanagawae TaxID=293069 RepID=A0ABY2M8G2_9LEPT|nr:murein transglycosylase [Leptospira yanagawae]